MTILMGILVYIMIWWVMLFAVLPWGVVPETSPEKGHPHGLPKNPNLLFKFIATTLISAVVWGGIYWAIDIKLIPLH